MENNELYNLIEDGQINTPSEMGIILREDIEDLSYEEILKRLQKSDLFEEVRLLKNDDEIVGSITYEDYKYDIKIYIGGAISAEIDISSLSSMNGLSEDELCNINKSKVNILTVMRFSTNAAHSYLAQLKILNCISSDYVALIDSSSEKITSGEWMRLTLEDDIEPLNMYLYTIHAVYSEENGLKKYWFHTHGLSRCGCIELEMLEISDESSNHYQALNTLASRFVEEGMIKRKHSIQVGYASNIYLNYTWIPWEEALKEYTKKSFFKKKVDILGGLEDRDNYHRQPSGVLFAVLNNKIEKVTRYNTLFHNNPIFFITNRESEKMSLSAKKRLNYFKSAFEKELLEKVNGYTFKAGILTDDASDEYDKEHLWFELKEIKDEVLVGKLINDAYRVSTMTNGEIYEIPINMLTDWTIYSEKGTFVPDNIYKYFQ